MVDVARRYQDEFYTLLPEAFRYYDSQTPETYNCLIEEFSPTNQLLSSNLITDLVVSSTSYQLPYDLRVSWTRRSGHSTTHFWKFVVPSSYTTPVVDDAYLPPDYLPVGYFTFNHSTYANKSVEFLTSDDVTIQGNSTCLNRLEITITITSNSHLRGFSDLVGSGLDQIYGLITNLQNFYNYSDDWFNKTWCEVLGFEELPDYLDQEQLNAVIPWLLRLYRLKGTMVPIQILTDKVFNYSADVHIEPYNELTGQLIVSQEFKTPPQYSDMKRISNLAYILTRFVPFYVKVVVAAKLIVSPDVYDRTITDSNLTLTVCYKPFVESKYPKPTEGQLTHIFITEGFIIQQSELNGPDFIIQGS